MEKSFKDYLKKIQEETTSGDIATVDNKLDLVKRPKKRKLCKAHKVENCKECTAETE